MDLMIYAAVQHTQRHHLRHRETIGPYKQGVPVDTISAVGLQCKLWQSFNVLLHYNITWWSSSWYSHILIWICICAIFGLQSLQC